MSKARLLVVDDDEDLRTQMQWALADEYEVTVAGDREEALAAVRASRFDLITLDLGLPPDAAGVSEGFNALSQIQGADPTARIIIITGRDDRVNALKAVAEGAYDFFNKPIDVAELKVVLRRAHQIQSLGRENQELQRQADAQGYGGILGSSPRMVEVFAAIRKLATVEATVLVRGESGTGKELVALTIHRESPRSAGPFVAINCGAIPENLLESELFGHEKGSFTGAHAMRKGRIESAAGGTLFLDEIGELPSALQVKLLRFLQDKQIERVGGRTPISVGTRIIAATNADLAQMMREGRFREDLYYRVSVVSVALPALRERGDDVLAIANAFLQRAAREVGRKSAAFAPDALAALRAHSWPGNVRELENRVRRAALMGEAPRVTAADLELAGTAADPGRPGLRELRRGLERETVREALQRNRGNITQTAVELGVSRPTLYALLEKLGIGR
jgi:two-component system, NtrC family, response regulator